MLTESKRSGRRWESPVIRVREDHTTVRGREVEEKQIKLFLCRYLDKGS